MMLVPMLMMLLKGGAGYLLGLAAIFDVLKGWLVDDSKKDGDGEQID